MSSGIAVFCRRSAATRESCDFLCMIWIYCDDG